MSAVINDLTIGRQSIDECNEHILFFNGFDRPRYYNIALNASGYLGIDDWSTYRYKPVAETPDTTGTLSDETYYSIIVVPVNGDIVAGGFPIYGNATLPSRPKLTTSTGQKIDFTIPVHPQKRMIVASVTSEAGAGTTATDNTQTWGTNEWAGYTIKNVETGLTDTIISNTSQVLTFTSLAFESGARYQILQSEITARYIYAAEDAEEGTILTNSFYLVGIVPDNTTTTFSLKSFIEGEIYVGDYFAPPNAFTGHVAGDSVFCGGGISVEGIGTSLFNGTTESKQASAESETVVSITDNTYLASGDEQIVRYTPASAFTDIYIGSYVTITDSADSGNDIASARVLRVADDKTWFEILNNTGVETADDAPDATMLIVMTPNIIEGTDTEFSEGMVDARFEFTNDDVGSYGIAWVDTITQEIGLTSLYQGNNAETTDAYRIKSDYNLYYSDFQNPHRYRSVSLIEIGDSIKGLYALGRNLLIWCSGSLWRINMLEPGAAPQMITDEILFDATWSICSNGKFVMFYDGEGISITDGVSIESVTAMKSRDYVSQINKELSSQIQGVYNKTDRRFEFSFPMGTETLNNYGINITEDSFNNVPCSRVDANVLFTGYEDGRFRIFHGTSGELSGGVGAIWTHTGATDGLTGTESESTITDVTGQVITVQGAAAITWTAGSIVTFYPADSGTYKQLMIESVVDNGSYEYELTFATAYDLTEYLVGDYILYGLIPFDYGIKWTDFSSPQYKKRMKELHIDLYGMAGKLFVDHFLDLNETAISSESKEVVATDPKLVYPFRMGKGYIYGFRIRGYSSTTFKINAFERIFGVIS